MPKLDFEILDVNADYANAFRAKVPGGWLVVTKSNSGGGVAFYPDPEHKWDGGSVADRSGKSTAVAPRRSFKGLAVAPVSRVGKQRS
jgi:hypothetical protein